MRRTVLIDDLTSERLEKANGPNLDPWDMLLKKASTNYDELGMALRLLGLFTSSGEDVPIKSISQLHKIMRDSNVGFKEDACILEAIFNTVWMKSLGKQDLQATVADLLSNHVYQTTNNLRNSVGYGET